MDVDMAYVREGEPNMLHLGTPQSWNSAGSWHIYGDVPLRLRIMLIGGLIDMLCASAGLEKGPL